MNVQLYDLKGIANYIVCRNTVLIDSNLPEAVRQELIVNFSAQERSAVNVV